MDCQSNSINNILGLPIVVINLPHLGDYLYLEALNMVIGLKNGTYNVWDIKENQIQKNEDLSQLIQEQKKIFKLPKDNQVLGQCHLTFTVFDLKYYKVVQRFPIQSEFIYTLEPNQYSNRLFMQYTGKNCFLSYKINNWKSQAVFLKQSFNCLFGKHTYYLYNRATQYIYRSKINKIIRTTNLKGMKFNYSDQWMIYQDKICPSHTQANNIPNGIAIVNNIKKFQRQSFSFSQQLGYFKIYFKMDKFVLILFSYYLYIIDINQNQILERIKIKKETGNFMVIEKFLGFKPNSCVYVFRCIDPY